MEQQPRNNKAGKIILFSVLGAGVIVGSVFMYRKFAKDSKLFRGDDFTTGDDESELPEIPVTAAATAAASTTPIVTYKPKPIDSGFPLKLKSRGKLVLDVQNALIKKYGADKVLTKYGADGIYDTELFDTLISKGLPTWIDAAAYAKIMAINNPKGTDDTKGSDTTNSGSSDTKDGNGKDEWDTTRINNYLVKAVKMPNFFWTVDALKKIKNKSQYNNVNIKFSKERVSGGTRKTIVNAVFDTFKDSKERKRLKEEFLRIGLNYDAKKNKWSLAGVLSGIKSTIDTHVWDAQGRHVPVKANTYLGQDIAVADGVIEFVTESGKHLFVESFSIANL